jgi:hypothetical protein
MGQKLRKGEWDPAKDKLPASVKQLVDYALKPDAEHTFEVELPKLAPGQFQGLFFDTVEAET